MTLLKLYRGFERAIAYALLLGMAGVVLLSLYAFVIALISSGFDRAEPIEYSTFQMLFDRVLAVIIALEIAHSIQQMATGDHRLAQVQTVIVIGVLAVVRKLILLEVESTSGLFLAGLAATIFALGALLVMIHFISRRENPLPHEPGI